ncbi:SCO1664 family protein [Actinoalloteichus caeruleus]|uniref:SCO1664 family protein n=1 Tax=Actinoalloteichus cyanogriseus TaxID=2893586 RepID=UPI0004AA48F1|nr:SCO1664 family protein [Actinoalloteichus caeruleus]
MGVDEADALALLERGDLEVRGRMVDASNATLFCEVSADGVTASCVYKPVRGERALWDFPDGTLAGREVATYLLSRAAGWDLVPPTVLREGPLGPGMAQLWIETTPEDALVDVVPPDRLPEGWRAVLHAHDRFGDPAVLAHADHPRLRTMAVLDVVANNADRKGGHVLRATDGAVYGVDHGICLNTEHKLRSVLWGWVGEPLSEEVREDLRRLGSLLDGSLAPTLGTHLTRKEVLAVGRRTAQLLAAPVFPGPSGDWPPIPWPVF